MIILKDAYFGIRRGFWEIAIFVLFCILAMALVAGTARAADINTSESYIIVEEPNESDFITSNVTVLQNATINASAGIPGPKDTAERRINQGDCVEVGETVDIAGTGWYSGVLAYYGRYYDGYAGAGNWSIEAIYNVKATELDHFYVDKFFATHKGWWYNYDPFTDTIGSHSYDRLFYVADSCVLTPKENATKIQEAFNESRERELIRENMTKLSRKTVSGVDFIISRNTTTQYLAPAGSRTWIFGNSIDDSYYGIRTEHNQTIFPKKVVEDLPQGEYNLLFVMPGNNTIDEVLYDKGEASIVSPFRSVKNVSMNGMVSTVAENRVISYIQKTTDDTYEHHRILVEDPYVEIKRLDQANLPNNRSMIVLSGYTNANAGDVVTIQVDAEKVNGITRKYTTWEAPVYENGGIGAYRQWNATILTDFNENLFPGEHWLTATTTTGGKATAQIYKRVEPAPHAQETPSIEFVGASPFIPPVYINTTVTVQVPCPERVVIREIPPTEKQVNDAGFSFALVWYTLSIVAVAAIMVLCFFIRWMVSVYRRTIEYIR